MKMIRDRGFEIPDQVERMIEKARTNAALDWFDSGIFLDKTKSPNGKGFRLKQHENNPDAPLSPFYLNFRLLRSFPTLNANTADLFRSMSHKTTGDWQLLADIPTAITPTVSILSLLMNKPIITPRTDEKKYGTGAKIDGVYKTRQVVILFDDLITKADSKLEAIQILENAGLIVSDVFVLVDRQQGGGHQLGVEGYNLHAAWTIRDLLKLYVEAEAITPSMHQEILDYLG